MSDEPPQNQSRLCPNCGAPLDGQGPAGNCPACLFALAAVVAPSAGRLGDTQPAPALLPPQLFPSPGPRPPSPPLEAGERAGRGGAQSVGETAPGPLRYFGDYELVEEIARGGMGVVYRARQVSLNRIVAVKVLLFGRFASDEFVRRFRAEAAAAANLDHPHIVGIHEVGEHEGQPYFSMDYIAGQNLAQRAQDAPLPPELAADHLRTIAEAVHYAHQRGILHRDLKPSNILIDALDQPHVTDFGLAKRLDEDTDLTRSGQVMGTPQYMSPEQARGQRGEVTIASDLYSLGAILYFLLTGRPPFQAETMEGVLQQVLQDEPKTPRAFKTATPRDLETICLKCLAKEPRARYATAQDLADDLGRFLRGEPIAARPVSAPERVWRWCRRKPALATLIVALHLVGALGLAGILWQWRDARRANRETTERLYESYLAQARGMRSGDIAGRRQAELDLLAKAVAIRPSLELRNETIAALATRDVRTSRAWALPDPEVGSWHFDADLRHYAVVDGTNGVAIRRAGDGGEVAVLRHPSRVVKELCGLHALSPDGRFVTVRFDGERHCVVWEVASGRVVLDEPGFQHGVDFSRDGNRFAASHADGSIRIHALPSGRKITSLPAEGPLDFVRFDLEGGRVLGCEVGETDFTTWDLASGQARTFTAPDRLNYADWGAGDQLAAGAATGRIFIWAARTGQLRQIIPAHNSQIQHVAFNHRGDLLASASWDGQTRFSNPWTGRVEIRLPRSASRLQFSRDGRQFGMVVLPMEHGSGHGLLDLEESPVLARIEGPGSLSQAWSLAFSPDGRWLASAAGEDGGLRIYDSAGRRLARAVPQIVGRTVVFEPDGRGLLATSSNGIVRLPLTTAGQGTNLTISFGPPQVIFPVRDVIVASLSRDGRWLACSAGMNELWLLDLTAPEPASLLGRQRSILSVAVSPDGQWVASGNWHGYDGVWIWNTRTREVVCRIPMGGVTLAWSQDGRWVAAAGNVDGHACKQLVIEADSWQLRYDSGRLPYGGRPAFSPDSRLVAFTSDFGRAIHLREVGSFRELATLEAPNHSEAVWLAFSPDGNRLAAQEYRQGIQIWDLARLREELRVRGLNWESPPPAR